MIRRAINKVLGCGCDSQDSELSELSALRSEVQTLRARVAELEAPPSAAGPVATASSFAQAAKAMASGQRVELDPGAPSAPGPQLATPEPAPAAPGRTLVVELEDCIACGTCVEYCANAFELGTDGRALVVDQNAPADELEEAISACPTQCIRWQD